MAPERRDRHPHAGRQSGSDARALSPAVGVALMAVVVVLLAAVVGGMVAGFGGVIPDPAPRVVFDATYVPSGEGNTDGRPYVNLTHRTGEMGDGSNVYVVDDAGNSVAWRDVWTGGGTVTTGEYVHVDGFGSDAALDPICEAGQSYRLVRRTDAGSEVLFTFEVPEDPDPIPTWC